MVALASFQRSFKRRKVTDIEWSKGSVNVADVLTATAATRLWIYYLQSALN